MTAAHFDGLRLTEVTIGYSSRRRRNPDSVVAEAISAAARPGELTALLGPNGAGKSTLLRTVCGLQSPLAGRVDLDGSDLRTLSPSQVARKVSVVLTERIDPGMLRVVDLVALGRTPHLSAGARMTGADHTAVDAAMSSVNITHLAHRPITELSDGQRQRVMVARALAQGPQLLVLDEPTSFLDVPSRVELMDILARLARSENIAVLISTHELELALRIADAVWLLDNAQLSADTPRVLAESGAIGRAFDRGRLHFDPARLGFIMAAD